MSNAAVTAAETEDKKDESARRWWHMNRKLLPMKAHYFLFYGSSGGTAAACILYCAKVGMSMSEIGTLYAVLPLVQFLSKIIFGGIADKYQRHKTTFLASICCLTVFMFSINFLPFPSDDLRNVTWTPADGATFTCLRHPDKSSPIVNESSAAEVMRLTLCDRNASNQFFTVLSSATVACDVSCDTFGLQYMSAMFCEKDNVACLSNDRNSFDEMPKIRLTRLNFEMSPDEYLRTGNSSCEALPIASVSFNSNSELYHEENKLNRTTMVTSSGCHLRNAELEVSITCEAVCVAAVKPSSYSPIATNRNKKLLYVWIWLAFIIAWSAYGTVVCTADTIVLHLLGGRTKDFGKNRLFGSIGWGLMSPLMGFIIDKVSEGHPEKNYAPGFYVFAAFMLVDFVVNVPTKVHIPEKSNKLAKDVLLVLRQPPVILTGFAVFITGITNGFLWTFLIVFATKLSGGRLLIIGLNYAVECFISEIPFFLVSGWVVSKLGHSHAITVSLFVCGLKTFLYTFVYNAWYILIIALLHGATFGLFYYSMATYIGQVSTPGTAATLQGIFQGIFEGIGASVGNFLGGYTYEHVGGHQAFLLFGTVTMAASVVHLIVGLILRWKAQQTSSGRCEN